MWYLSYRIKRIKTERMRGSVKLTEVSTKSRRKSSYCGIGMLGERMRHMWVMNLVMDDTRNRRTLRNRWFDSVHADIQDKHLRRKLHTGRS